MIYKAARLMIGVCFLTLGIYIVLVDLWHNSVLHVISAIVGLVFVIGGGVVANPKLTQRVIDTLVRTFRRAKDAEGGKPDEPDVDSGSDKGRPRVR